MRTQKEIEEYLDVHVSEIILQLKAKVSGIEPVKPVILAAYISGFLVATAIKIAHAEGAPRAVVEKALMEVIRRQYKS